MTSLTLPRHVLLLAFLALACVKRASPAVSASPPGLDLAPARATPVTPSTPWLVGTTSSDVAFARCPSPRCGLTGHPVSLSLDTRRERVIEVFNRYVAALGERSAQELRSLFAEQITALGMSGREMPPFAREAVILWHEPVFQAVGRTGLQPSATRVLSFDECRTQNCGTAMRPGDWYIDWRSAAVRQPGLAGMMSTPNSLLVRWIDDEPRIVGMSDAFLNNGRRP